MAGLLEKSVISPNLIGRDEQLAALVARLKAARAGQGQIVLLSGEAGLGKTRLIAAAKAEAAHFGFTVLQGNCLEPEQAWPYAPLIDLLRGYQRPPAETRPPEAAAAVAELAGLLPELAAWLPAGQTPALGYPDQYRLFNALERFFYSLAAQTPLLLVIEDIHWSDDATLDFLLHLTGRFASRPLLLLLTGRDEAPGPSLARFLLALNRAPLARELALAPLSGAQVEAMLRSIFEQDHPVSGEFVSEIFRLTEGNPFFIEEVLKALLAAGDIFWRGGEWDRKPIEQLRIPRSIQLAVQQRVAQLEPGAGQLMLLAAVIGRRFCFDLLREMTGMDEQRLLVHLKQLMAAQIIVEDSAGAYAFRHALTREAVYGTLLRRERQYQHRRIGEILEGLDTDRPDRHLADLAHHYYMAEAWDKVLIYAQRAGDRARALHAPREASELYTRALAAAQHLGQPPTPELLRARGQAFETLGEIEAARADYEQALGLSQQAQDRRTEWQCLVELGSVWSAKDYVRAGDFFRRALALARDEADPALVARSLNRVGNWHVNREQPRTARKLHQEALALFQRLDDPHGQAETLDLLGLTTQMTGDFVAGFGFLRQAAGLFEALEDRRGLASSLVQMGECGASYFADGVLVAPITLAEGLTYATQSLEISRQIGWRPGTVYAQVIMSLGTGSLGHLAQALEQAGQALAEATEIEHHQWMAFAHLACGLAYGSALAWAREREHYAEALALARQVNSTFWTTAASSLLAMNAVRQNDLARAGALLAPSGGPAAPLHTFAEKLAALARAELALALGQPAQAEAELLALMAVVYPAELKRDQPWQAALRLVMVHGQVLAAQRRFPEAEARLREALTAAEAQGARPLQWRLHAALGAVAQAQRRFGTADEVFAAARALIEALAEEMPDGDLRANFRRTALAALPAPRPGAQRRAAKREFGGLTERERDVAGLVAQGRSNREIAAALVLSERTVEKHVSNILGKLALEKRAEIIAWAHQHALAPKTPD